MQPPPQPDAHPHAHPRALAARCNWLLARWAGELMGFSDERADLFAWNTTKTLHGSPTHEQLIHVLLEDLHSLNKPISRQTLEKHYARLRQMLETYLQDLESV